MGKHALLSASSSDRWLHCPPSARLSESYEQDFSDVEDWRSLLRYMPRSSLLENSVWNLNLILNNDPDFTGFAYNELAGRIQITGPLPWDRPEGNQFWRDADTAQLKSLIDDKDLWTLPCVQQKA